MDLHHHHYLLKAGFELIKEGFHTDAKGNPLNPIFFYYSVLSNGNSPFIVLPFEPPLLINIHGSHLKHSVWEAVSQSFSHGDHVFIEEAKKLLHVNAHTTDLQLTAMTLAVLHWADKWVQKFIVNAHSYHPLSHDMKLALQAVRHMFYETRH
jgi:hypothetical protein